MTRALAAVLAIFLCACGETSDPAGPPAAVAGNWILVGDTRAVALDMRADGDYVFGLIDLTGSTQNARTQVEKGTFTADAKNIAFTPAQASCPGPIPRWGDEYSADANSFTLLDPNGALIFGRNTASTTTGASIVYGCFDKTTGAFTASPLAPVSN